MVIGINLKKKPKIYVKADPQLYDVDAAEGLTVIKEEPFAYPEPKQE